LSDQEEAGKMHKLKELPIGLKIIIIVDLVFFLFFVMAALAGLFSGDVAQFVFFVLFACGMTKVVLDTMRLKKGIIKNYDSLFVVLLFVIVAIALFEVRHIRVQQARARFQQDFQAQEVLNRRMNFIPGGILLIVLAYAAVRLTIYLRNKKIKTLSGK
jgi:hypothetical protein